MTASETMTNPNCPSEETLAAFIDGRLDEEARKAVTEHLANCADCRDTVVFADEMREAGIVSTESAPAGSVVRGSFGPRWLAPAFAAAAVLVVVFSVPAVRQRLLGRSGVAQLVAASRELPDRPIEGRLSGGFEHRVLQPTMRGGVDDGELTTALARQKLAAAAAEVARETRDAHTRGVAELLLGEHDEAIASLEQAARKAPRDATVLSDLSAAYSARARARGNAGDVAAAIERANRAWAVRQAPEIAWNRAVALSAAGDADAAERAWDDFLRVADDEAWRAEAVRRRAEVR